LKNRDLIIKTARRLDKFNLDEMIVVSELDEKEVSEILSDLVKQQIVLKNNNTYFFNTKKSIEINNTDNIETGFKPIIIEEEEGYDRFLSL
jgi:choline kinase